MGHAISSKKAATATELNSKTNISQLSREDKLQRRLRTLEETVGKLVEAGEERASRADEMAQRLDWAEADLTMLKLAPLTGASTPMSHHPSPVRFGYMYGGGDGCKPTSFHDEHADDTQWLSIPDTYGGASPAENTPASPGTDSQVSAASSGSRRPRRRHITHTMSDIEAYGKGLNPHDVEAKREYTRPESPSPP